MVSEWDCDGSCEAASGGEPWGRRVGMSAPLLVTASMLRVAPVVVVGYLVQQVVFVFVVVVVQTVIRDSMQ